MAGSSALFSVLLGAVAAEGLKLTQPIDCTLGQDCFVQQFVDHDPSQNVHDYACGGATYNGHKGTDFRLPTGADMARGVNVLAAADGTVAGVRTDMPDARIVSKAGMKAVKGKECGNGVMIEHPGDWRTQYCHMKQGSILVEPGQDVSAGDVLGQVGVSGKTQFPHLHISVYKGKHIVDPFVGETSRSCGVEAESTLWDPDFAALFAYQPTRVLAVGFADQKTGYNDVVDGVYDQPPAGDPEKPLLIYGLMANVEIGDVVALQLLGPSGIVAESESEPFEARKAQWLSYTGKKSPAGGWPAGTYQGSVKILRGGVEIAADFLEFQFEQ